MSTRHAFPRTDDLDKFFAQQRARLNRALTRRVQKIERARHAAKSEDVMTDALVVTTRGWTHGGARKESGIAMAVRAERVRNA